MNDTYTKEEIEEIVTSATNKLFTETVKAFKSIDRRFEEIENFIKEKDMKIETEQAPPLGLMPIREWQFARKLAIEAAIVRHVIAGYEVQDGWIKELNELNEILATS